MSDAELLWCGDDTVRALRWIRDHRAHPKRLSLDEARAAVQATYAAEVLSAGSEVERGAMAAIVEYAAKATWAAMTEDGDECRPTFCQGRLDELLRTMPQ